MFRKMNFISCAISLAFALAGCGGSRGPELGEVEGTVTLDGALVSGAMVTFQPKDTGSYSAAYTDDRGQYRLVYSRTRTGAMVGTHEVSITTLRDTEDRSGKPIRMPESIPPEYNSATQLVREVDSGSNVVDFALESKGFKPTFKVKSR